jgi:hypothetical protein
MSWFPLIKTFRNLSPRHYIGLHVEIDEKMQLIWALGIAVYRGAVGMYKIIDLLSRRF